jgi:hypothetical protein
MLYARFEQIVRSAAVEREFRSGSCLQRRSERSKEKVKMKKLYLPIALVLLGLAARGTPANAQDIDQVIVTVPFQFVVASATLPAGTYHVSRVSDDPHEGLLLTCREKHTTAVVIPADVENVSEEKPEFGFETAGDAHFLSRIQTDDKVFEIPVSKAKLTQALAHNNISASR